MTILVTGATGNVGSNVLKQLVERDVALRVLTRRPEHPRLQGLADVRQGDLTDPAVLPAVLDGVSAVFLYATPDGGAAFVEAAKAAGVRRVVLLSSMAVQDGAQHDNPISKLHTAVEGTLRASGLGWTFLRPSEFAGNAMAWVPQIRSGGVVRVPYPNAVGLPIDEVDIAAVAVAALLEDGHEGQVYQLTGPQALTQAEQVAAIGAAIGRDIPCEQISDDAYRAAVDGLFPPGYADVLLDMWRGSVGTPQEPLPTVASVTGRPANDFATWACQHALVFGT